jgi:transposase InsO family protein
MTSNLSINHYLDDLVIYSSDFDQHLDHVAQVFSRLRDTGLTVKPSKVVLGVQEISFLGHRVSPLGISIDPQRTEAIRKFPHPRDVKGISRFVGMINFYHKFIPNLADIAAPLNALRKKGVKFVWGKDQQIAFDKLKEAISQPPVLRMADFSKPFALQTDASGVALGAVLSQDVDGFRQPIAYASRTLSVQERKASSIYELECLAVLFGMDKFRPYLEHTEFLLETDNQALSWLLSHPRQLGKIGRWVVKISSLKFKVQHVRGTQNVVEDALSGMFDASNHEAASASCHTLLTKFPLAFCDLATLQREDPELLSVLERLERNEPDPKFSLVNGVLHCRSRFDHKRKVVVPMATVPMLFNYYHTSPLGGHLGVFKTIQKIRENFIWQAIRARVRSCTVCGLSKPAQNTRFGLLASEVASRPFQKLFIDYVGKLPRSKAGNTMLLVCVDSFSKFVWLVPVREATTAATIRVLKERIFSNFSVPEVVVSDNAKCFVSREFKQFCFGLGIQHVTTTPYYPQPSHAERFNRNLRSALIAYYSHSQTSWDEGLMFLQLAFNTAKHESTRATPFEVMFPFRAGSPLLHNWGIQELLPDNCTKASIQKRWADVRKSLFQSHQRIAQNYNKGRIPQPFKVGDIVFLKNHPHSDTSRKIAGKLCQCWRGPFRLQSFLTTVTARLVNPTTGEYVARAHLSQVKPADVS